MASQRTHGTWMGCRRWLMVGLAKEVEGSRVRGSSYCFLDLFIDVGKEEGCPGFIINDAKFIKEVGEVYVVFCHGNRLVRFISVSYGSMTFSS